MLQRHDRVERRQNKYQDWRKDNQDILQIAGRSGACLKGCSDRRLGRQQRDDHCRQ
jgi:hypothetical protein